MTNPPFALPIPRRGALSVPDNEHKRKFLVVDEAFCYSTTRPGKVIVLQKLKFNDCVDTELRVGYYLHDGNKWGFIPKPPMMSFEDFQAIVHEATKKGWLAVSHG